MESLFILDVQESIDKHAFDVSALKSSHFLCIQEMFIAFQDPAQILYPEQAVDVNLIAPIHDVVAINMFSPEGFGCICSPSFPIQNNVQNHAPVVTDIHVGTPAVLKPVSPQHQG